ncbi:unnamed protein product [Amoebophrya sp. A120]|nr:unnamed protein product [Amoebophrya sp. A120]|eukprot:GSA120T00005730001.1
MAQSVAFCGREQWIAWDEDSVIGHSHKLPASVRSMVRASAGIPRQNLGYGPPTIADFGMAEGGALSHYIDFGDGPSRWNVSRDFDEAMEKYDDVEIVALGCEGSYIIAGESATSPRSWKGVPENVAQSLNNNTSSLDIAALGAGGNYFIQYSSGRNMWGGAISATLTELFEDLEEDITDVVFSAFDEEAYYITFSDGTADWRGGGESLFIALLDDKIHYFDTQKIFYVHETIRDTFSCGKSIFKTAEDLKKGTISVEDIEPIEVVKHSDKYYTLSHRRLWAFINANLVGVPVKVVDMPVGMLKKIKKNPSRTAVSVV